MENKEFIIGKKLYSTEDSILLCKSSDPFEATNMLYRTSKGNYFKIVEMNIAHSIKAEVLNEDEAFRYMDENANDIIKENYIKVFGNVEKG